VPVHFIFRYTSGDSAFSGVSNEMIAVIAEDEIKNRRRVSFTLNTELQILIETPAGRNPMIGITARQQKLSGSTRFRKFPMSSVMMPGRVRFGCRIEKKDSSSFFDLPEIEDRNFIGNDSTILQCQVPHFSCDSDTVVLDPLHFYFDPDALERFRARVTLVNDYYAASAILDSLEKKVFAINLGDLGRYPGNFIILEELNKILAIINEKNFSQRLALDSLDPAGFLVKYKNLARFSHSATMTFSENMKTPGTLKSAFSPDSLIRQFIDRTCVYIRWSMLVSERNSGIYHEFLERYFHMNAFGDDHEVIQNLVVKMFPDQIPDSALAMISRKINKAYHERADEMMKNRQYAEAVELLGNARNFIRINPYLKETGDRLIITEAANGIYDSFLGVADGAIRNGKPEMARSYMLRAQHYRKEHADYVTSDSLFNKVFGELVAGNLSRCDTLFTSSRYPEALGCYQEFEKGFDSLTLSSIHRVLGPKIQYCRYKMLIGEGEKDLSKDDKPEAGRNFFLARQLAQDAKFAPDSLLDSLCRVTYPFYLIHLLNTGEGRIWTNRLESARIFADSIAFIQRTTGVGSSRELSDALAGYRRKVEERTCWNTNQAVEVFLLRSQHERDVKDFIIASSLADSAVSLSNQFSDCEIPLKGVNDTAKKYLEPLEFQQMLRQVEVSISAARYKDAITGFLQMENFTRSHDIGSFGLSVPPMFDYISNRSVQDLTLQAFLYFKEKHELEQAFRYLKLLRLQDYPRRSAKEPLEWLGRELAGQDFTDRPDQDPVGLVKLYTGTDKWMRSFRMKYYEEATRLRHQPGIKYLIRKYFP
jgi:hypothetical protein